jgi:hypothetical protein
MRIRPVIAAVAVAIAVTAAVGTWAPLASAAPLAATATTTTAAGTTGATAATDLTALVASAPPSPTADAKPCSVTTGGGHTVSGSCTCAETPLGTLCFVANCVVSGIHLVQQTYCYILNFGDGGYWTGTIYLLAGFVYGYFPVP